MPARKRATTKRTPTKRATASRRAALARARAPRTCPVCGREVAANNYARHLATHGATTHSAALAGSSASSGEPSERAVTVAVGALLDQYRAAAANGKQGRTGGVALGRIGHGLPTYTRDPEQVERALEVYDAEIIPRAGSAVVELKARQRRRDLAAALEQLRASANGRGPRELFVAHGARWAAANGIDYATFRDMGLPASLLREAGVPR